MEHPIPKNNFSSSWLRCLAGVFVCASALLCWLAPPASAGFEEVATFAESGESRQLNGANSMAVNTTGAGGVPPGTLYSVTNYGQRVASFDADGGFRQAWGWSVSVPPESPAQFERCGPEGEVAHPVCSTELFGDEGEGEGQLNYPQGIAVDQTTGYVYVLNSVTRKQGVVQIFSADGSQLIASFGETGEFAEPVANSPGKIHYPKVGGIAVDDSGTVYVSDGNSLSPGSEARVMVFEPSAPGDYENYVYAGQSSDIDVSSGPIAVDAAGNLYGVSAETDVFRLDPSQLGAVDCDYKFSAGGIGGIAVDRSSGESYFFTYKDKKIHRLSACDGGQIEEIEAFAPAKKTSSMYALAFNPVLPYEPTRPLGILYGGDAEDPGRGIIFAPAEVRFPVIESEEILSATSSTATLRAQINPKGSSTRYVFQYLTEAAYEANEPGERFAGADESPAGGGVLAPSQKGLPAVMTLTGLLADTRYRYRVIATSQCDPEEGAPLCEVTGPEQTFKTFPKEIAGLSDQRAYELVSPALKHGGEVFPPEPTIGRCGFECKPGAGVPLFPMQSAPDGESVVYQGYPFSFTGGAPAFNQYLATRTDSGWRTANPSPELSSGGGVNGYKGFDSALTQGVIYQRSPSLSPEAPPGYANLYLQDVGSPADLVPLIRFAPPNRTSTSFEVAYAGQSTDSIRVFFAANDALTPATGDAPAAEDGGPTKYNLYQQTGGELQLVNVLPGNASTLPGARFGQGLKNGLAIRGSHAVSDDGSRVFWSSEAGQVFVRLNGEITEEIPDHTGKFLAAATDGSRVLLDNGLLYDVDDLAAAPDDLTQGEGGFVGMLGQSEDLSAVYFVDTVALTGEEQSDRGEQAADGANNLYVWQDGILRFIAKLSPSDNSTMVNGGDWMVSPSRRTAEASPNGQWLTFLSKAKLTGYDNFGPSCAYNSVKEYVATDCFEAFVYSLESDRLICASCNPSEAHPLGRTFLPVINGADDSMPQPSYLTDSGRLFFNTQDSITPFDTNNGVEDVYQFEPQGVGTCDRADGCVSLISSGREPTDANFVTMDPSGSNAFFATRQQLVAQDRDDLIDLYDARVGGGFPPPPPPAGCEGEACQAPPNTPAEPAPASSTFEPSTGAKPLVCKKNQVKKKGRCVKKPRHKKRAHKQRSAKSQSAERGQGGSK